MSPKRRDAEGRLQVGPTWESLIERQLREAAEAGAFDDLPFRGEPVPLDDDGTEWALAHHMLRQAGVSPSWIETDREIRELLARRDDLFARASRAGPPVRERDRRELTNLVESVNRLVFRLEIEAPGPAEQRRPLDLAAELARLDEGRGR